MNENKSNDLQTIITQVIEEMKSEQGDKFDLNKINLAEMERRTGLTRAQLRRIKANGFLVVPHALTGRKATSTIISGYTGVIDDLLKKNVSNSEVILERIQEQGYTGSLTTVKDTSVNIKILFRLKDKQLHRKEIVDAGILAMQVRAIKWIGDLLMSIRMIALLIK